MFCWQSKIGYLQLSLILSLCTNGRKILLIAFSVQVFTPYVYTQACTHMRIYLFRSKVFYDQKHLFLTSSYSRHLLHVDMLFLVLNKHTHKHTYTHTHTFAISYYTDICVCAVSYTHLDVYKRQN